MPTTSLGQTFSHAKIQIVSKFYYFGNFFILLFSRHMGTWRCLCPGGKRYLAVYRNTTQNQGQQVLAIRFLLQNDRKEQFVVHRQLFTPSWSPQETRNEIFLVFSRPRRHLNYVKLWVALNFHLMRNVNGLTRIAWKRFVLMLLYTPG